MKKRIFCVCLTALLLCGCAPKAEETVFTPDYPTLSATEPEDPEAILAYRRDVVEQAMRDQSAILWTPAETFSYSRRHTSMGVGIDRVESPGDVTTFEAGKIYQGIPYTHGCGNYDSFLSYASQKDENGVYTLSGVTDQHMTGYSSTKANRRSRLGNDCADQVYWSWARVSSSIKFNITVRMTEAYGCLKVGDYEFTGSTFSADNNTKDIVAENGEQRMFAAYALLQKGDGMVLVNKKGQGHAVMVVTTNPVYLSDGTIDGEESYVTVLEQNSGEERDLTPYYNEQIGEMVYPCEIMDKQWTYNTLFKKGYLPVTCKELIDPSPLPEVQVYDNAKNLTAENMFTGVVGSNYRFSSITVTISQKGKVIQQATCYSCQDEMFEFGLYRFTSPIEQPVMQGSIHVEDLPAGSYQCTFSAKLSTGENVVFRSFELTK